MKQWKKCVVIVVKRQRKNLSSRDKYMWKIIEKFKNEDWTDGLCVGMGVGVLMSTIMWIIILVERK